VRVRGLAVGSGGVDLLMQRYANNVGIEATRKHGRVEVAVVI
jgi:hypothetical protein